MVNLIISEIVKVDKSTQTDNNEEVSTSEQIIKYLHEQKYKKIYVENKIIREYLIKKNRNSKVGNKINEDFKLEQETIEKLNFYKCEIPSWLLFRCKNKC
jgi:hypothetical protein